MAASRQKKCSCPFYRQCCEGNCFTTESTENAENDYSKFKSFVYFATFVVIILFCHPTQPRPAGCLFLYATYQAALLIEAGSPSPLFYVIHPWQPSEMLVLRPQRGFPCACTGKDDAIRHG